MQLYWLHTVCLPLYRALLVYLGARSLRVALAKACIQFRFFPLWTCKFCLFHPAVFLQLLSANVLPPSRKRLQTQLHLICLSFLLVPGAPTCSMNWFGSCLRFWLWFPTSLSARLAPRASRPRVAPRRAVVQDAHAAAVGRWVPWQDAPSQGRFFAKNPSGHPKCMLGPAANPEVHHMPKFGFVPCSPRVTRKSKTKPEKGLKRRHCLSLRWRG